MLLLAILLKQLLNHLLDQLEFLLLTERFVDEIDSE